MTRTKWGLAPSLDDFAAMAREALDQLDEPFRTLARTAVIKIEDFADDEVLDQQEIQDPLDLTGLYQGVALTEDQPWSNPSEPPKVWLYRVPILYEWSTTSDVALEDLVAHVVIHELGHHFGWSDEEMDVVNDRDD